ncbi:MAG: peptidylprolyl isomerase PEB4 [Terrimicrobiaceae bacterium]
MKIPHILALTTLALSPLGRAQDSGIIARVSGEDVTAATLAPFFDGLSAQERKALEENPALLSQTVRNVILRRLLMKEALASGWDKKPEVQERLEQVKDAVVLESYLAELTRPPAGFPSDKEVQEIYEARKAELVVPKQLRLAQIYVPQTESADKVQAAAAKALVDQVQAKLKAPNADFAKIADEANAGRTGTAPGGEIGWVAQDSLQPEVRKAVEALKAGAVAGPVQLDDGFYFVKVLEIKDSRTATLEEVKPRIVDLLREQRIRQNREAYLAKLQQQHPMSLNELQLPVLLKEKN